MKIVIRYREAFIIKTFVKPAYFGVLPQLISFSSGYTNVSSNYMTPLHPHTFFFDLPLYVSIDITSENEQELHNLLSPNFTIEAYNPSLKQESTFKISKPRGTIYTKQPDLYSYEGFHQFELQCVRNGYKIITYAVVTSEENENGDDQYSIIKIGQFPSIADLHISKIKNYDKVLDKEKLKEITRAVGLAANGVGIGSFVYLRRVFEHLLEEAHQAATQDKNWDEKLYKRNRVVERIEQLKEHLPEFLVKNKSIYGILSVGIHSLNENDCLKYFDAVKVGIELILDEKVEKLNKTKKLEEAENRLQLITQIVSKK